MTATGLACALLACCAPGCNNAQRDCITICNCLIFGDGGNCLDCEKQ